MADLNILREAESNASETIEAAKKEAQHICIQTPDIIEELTHSATARYKKEVAEAEERIQKKVDEFAEKLSAKTDEKSIALESHIDILQKKAEELLIRAINKKTDN